MILKSKIFLALVTILLSSSLYALIRYEIEVAHHDEFFIINGEKYQAKTYCLGWDKGDPVIFLDGCAYGACVSATLYNERTKNTCEMWCE